MQERRVVPFQTYRSMRWVVHSIFSEGEYSFPEVPSWEPRLILDIGANVGAFAVWASLRFPAARIFSYEPVSRTFAVLRENLREFPNATPLNFGIFDRDVFRRIYYGRNNPGECSIYRGTEQRAEGERVELRRASSELARLGARAPDILKIDTEGCELAILHDLTTALPDIGVILLEFHSSGDHVKIEKLLKEGFSQTGCAVQGAHRGVLRYVNRGLAAARKSSNSPEEPGKAGWF